MDTRDRISLAAGVLATVCRRGKPHAQDVKDLRDLAESEDERNLPVDDLASAILNRSLRAIVAAEDNQRQFRGPFER
jgi:hypothetical protein